MVHNTISTIRSCNHFYLPLLTETGIGAPVPVRISGRTWNHRAPVCPSPQLVKKIPFFLDKSPPPALSLDVLYG